jgi:PTS system cellobiose-specific IIB component
VLPQLNDDKIDVQALTEAHYSAITGGNEIMADKRIVLFCAGGMSTSLLVNKMRDAAAAAGKNYSIDAYGLAAVDEKGPEADCILLGPQVRYALKQLQAKFPGKPIDGIDMRVYGMMDGKGAIAIARKLLND